MEHEKVPGLEFVTNDNFKQDSLVALKEQLASQNYPDYPSIRLVLEELEFYSQENGWCINLPDGPWETTAEAVRPTNVEQTKFKEMKLEIDQLGRPVHPWIDNMVRDTCLGVVTGKGAYWNWGPNYTADPIVTRGYGEEREILLVQRSDTGRWALPGGFVDKGESPFETALREAKEETGLDIVGAAETARPIYDGPLADLRVTANAWPHTFAFHFDATDLGLGVPHGQDDAIASAWVGINGLPGVLFGSHSLLIKMALE